MQTHVVGKQKVGETVFSRETSGNLKFSPLNPSLCVGSCFPNVPFELVVLEFQKLRNLLLTHSLLERLERSHPRQFVLSSTSLKTLFAVRIAEPSRTFPDEVCDWRTKQLTIIPIALVGYEMIDNHLISNKREWNNCFIKNHQEMLIDLADFALQDNQKTI